MKIQFYKILKNDEQFCCELGRFMLVAGNLEVLLKQYLRIHGEDISEKKATLGNLIGILRQKGHLTKNGEMHFSQANIQRNYLIHNLYGSFVNEIEKALLPVNDLVPLDVMTYTEKVIQAKENFEAYLEIISEAIENSKENIIQKKSKPVLL